MRELLKTISGIAFAPAGFAINVLKIELKSMALIWLLTLIFWYVAWKIALKLYRS